MKKFLKILLIIILFLLAVLFVTPILFKGKIMEIAKEQINKNVNAKVEFDDLGLSFIKNFPYASIALKKLSVAGVGKFEDDTLLKLNSFNVKVDIISAIKMENIKVKGIVLDRPEINAIKLEDGSVNWDIMKETEEKEEEVVDTAVSEFTATVALKKFEIRDAGISYTDDSSNMAASLDNFDFLLKGDLSQDFTTLSIISSTEMVNLLMEEVRYVKDASLNININLDADLENSIFILKENEVALNDLSLGFDGSVRMPNEEDMEVDMKFKTNKVDFKSLLSLVPAIYMKDFQDVQTTGKLKLDGYIKGVYNSKGMPDVGLDLLVENAMFKYPDLPKSADNIQIDVDLFFDGVQNDNTKVDINKFHVELGDNPVDLVMNIKTPVSDLYVNGSLSASIDFASLADVIPMEDVSLTGTIKSNLDMMGYISYIENEEYEKFKADGNVKISRFEFTSPDLPAAVKIIESSLSFSPEFVQVSSFSALIGESDMQFEGRLENFIPYMFKDETVGGKFTFTAGLLNLNEFMTGEEEPEAEVIKDTVPLSVIEVPENIDFRLISKIDKIIYDKLEIDDTYGIISIRDGKVVLENLSMDLLQGSMKLNGEYNTQDISAPVVDFGIRASGIDIPSAFNAFDVVAELAPVAKNATGKINLDMTYNSLLDEQMSPVMNSIAGKGSFSSQQIGISNSGIFSKIGKELKTDKFDNLSLEDVAVDFEIRDGRVYIDP
ncbi:MAG: AsmA family protein, partial [Bacteroidales bacterium]